MDAHTEQEIKLSIDAEILLGKLFNRFTLNSQRDERIRWHVTVPAPTKPFTEDQVERFLKDFGMLTTRIEPESDGCISIQANYGKLRHLVERLNEANIACFSDNSPADENNRETPNPSDGLTHRLRDLLNDQGNKQTVFFDINPLISGNPGRTSKKELAKKITDAFALGKPIALTEDQSKFAMSPVQFEALKEGWIKYCRQLRARAERESAPAGYLPPPKPGRFPDSPGIIYVEFPQAPKPNGEDKHPDHQIKTGESGAEIVPLKPRDHSNGPEGPS